MENEEIKENIENIEEIESQIDEPLHEEEKTLEQKLEEQDEFAFLDKEEVQEETSQDLITVRPVKFQEFEATPPNRTIKKNLDIMQDVSMHISVELGRAKSTIKDVMGYSAGSIVELDKIAGEQVEVFVNEKLVAKGEVIVIEDKFGVRVTSTNIQKQI